MVHVVIHITLKKENWRTPVDTTKRLFLRLESFVSCPVGLSELNYDHIAKSKCILVNKQRLPNVIGPIQMAWKMLLYTAENRGFACHF